MSIFSTWFQSQINAQGWDQREAAQHIGVRETTVHNWLHQNGRPNGQNVLRIALALSVSVDEVARQAGYDDIPAITSKVDATVARAEILAKLPQFADVIDRIARKPLEQQSVYIDLIRRLLLDGPLGTDSESK